MSQTYNEILAANRCYANYFGEKRTLCAPPARRAAILTCMDARLDPARACGLAEGDADIIRNAGGRASDDAIRSLVVSHKLHGTREFYLIRPTDGSLQQVTDADMGEMLAQSLDPATRDWDGWHDFGEGTGTDHGRFVAWLSFTDLTASLVEDVSRIRTHPMVAPTIRIYGFIYDSHTGLLHEVPEATQAGLPTQIPTARRRALGSYVAPGGPQPGRPKMRLSANVSLS